MSDTPRTDALAAQFEGSEIPFNLHGTIRELVGLARQGERSQQSKSGGGQHVAWLRYDNHNGQRPTTVHLCDSDAPGAFKVYRALAPEAACRNCGATERPDQCSGGPWCAYPPPKPGHGYDMEAEIEAQAAEYRKSHSEGPSP